MDDRVWVNFTYNTIVSVLLCGVIHFAARAVFKKLAPTLYATLPKADRISLAEKINSSIHGFVGGAMALNLVFVQGVWEHDVINTYADDLNWLFAMSTGYEIYDIVTMYFQKDPDVIMWVHHTLIIVGYQIVMRYHKLAFVASLMLITELTVLPSNVHWYLKVMGKKDTRAFHFNQGLRLWSYIGLRLWTAPFAFYRLWQQWEQFMQEELFLRAAACIITVLLGAMNLHWTYLMFRLYRKRERLYQTRERLRAAGLSPTSPESPSSSPSSDKTE